jgi:hypothetical protein
MILTEGRQNLNPNSKILLDQSRRQRVNMKNGILLTSKLICRTKWRRLNKQISLKMLKRAQKIYSAALETTLKRLIFTISRIKKRLTESISLRQRAILHSNQKTTKKPPFTMLKPCLFFTISSLKIPNKSLNLQPYNVQFFETNQPVFSSKIVCRKPFSK